MISHSEIIPIPLEEVWGQFLYKIEHPENFVPGVSNVHVIERNKEYVLRSMDMQPNGGNKISLTEKITFAPYWVKFQIIEHPVYTGYVENIAERISLNETLITYKLGWVNKETGESFNNQDMIKNAVLKTVEYILKNSEK
jgi:hypothetical protein